MAELQELLAVIHKLRSPEGCAWDRAQSPETVKMFVLEEAYEVVDAVDRGSAASIREELGDLLFNIGLLCQMYQESGAFSIAEVIADITNKVVRRHPHVFGPSEAKTTDATAILKQWDQIKMEERSESGPASSLLDGVPRALPALLRAQTVGRKAARVGFDWSSVEGPRSKIDEELNELAEAMRDGDEENIAEELGDVLFSVVNLARHLKRADGTAIDAESALRKTTQKFESRFRLVEEFAAREGQPLHQASLETLDAWWNRAKEVLAD